MVPNIDRRIELGLGTYGEVALPGLLAGGALGRNRGVWIVRAVNTTHRRVGAAPPAAAVWDWTRVVTGHVLLPANLTSQHLVLTEGRWVTELAAIAALVVQPIGEVPVKAAAAVAHIQVVVTKGLQCMVAGHSKDDRAHAFDGRLALGFRGKPVECLCERRHP